MTRPGPLLKSAAAAFVVLLALDALWLGVIARGFYTAEMADLMADRVQVLPALLFYLGYPLGLVLLCMASPTAGGSPATGAPQTAAADPLRPVLWRAAIVALMAYGTYDLTNWATLDGWSWRLSLVDIGWGVVASLAAAFAAWRVSRPVGGSVGLPVSEPVRQRS